MLGAILAWPDRLRAGFDLGIGHADQRLHTATDIVVCAMGASGIGASLAGELLADQLTVPFSMVRDYDLPAAVGPNTLVVAVSHSGETEETLSAYRQARERGARLLAITTGGELAKRAAADGVACIQYECPGQPRAALPMVLGLWLKLLGTLGYAPDQSATVAAALAHLDEIVRDVQGTKENQAVEIAGTLAGRLPIVYGAGFLGEAARRVKGQISENGKQTAAWEVLPEQNHNALVGYEFPKNLGESAVFVLLRAGLEHPRHAARFEFMKNLLDRRQLTYVEITGTGPDRLSQLVSVVFWGDLSSYELARRNGVDPTPVDVIAELKDSLAESDA